jgi:hypothetical protein
MTRIFVLLDGFGETAAQAPDPAPAVRLQLRDESAWPKSTSRATIPRKEIRATDFGRPHVKG